MRGVTSDTKVFALGGPFTGTSSEGLKPKITKAILMKLGAYLKGKGAQLLVNQEELYYHGTILSGEWTYAVDGCALYLEMNNHEDQTQMQLAIGGKNRDEIINDLKEIIPEAFESEAQ